MKAVRTAAGETVACDAVVSNMDASAPTATGRRRAGAQFTPRKRFEPACSGVVLYLGLNRRYDHLAHHDFVFSRDPEEEFDCIYTRGEPAPDPTCYLAAPSRHRPGVGAAGRRGAVCAGAHALSAPAS